MNFADFIYDQKHICDERCYIQIYQKPIHDGLINPVPSLPIEEPKTIRDASNNEIKNASFHGPFEEFSSDLLSLLSDTSSSDVTIKSGTEDFKAHKNILSARCAVFKAMFSNPMLENSEGIVLIDDIDPEIVRTLVSFIYSNQVHDLSVQKACDLLDAAEKYQLQSLKNICVDFLKSSLLSENAFLILQKAELYDKELKEHAMKFISEKFRDLRETEEWKNVQSSNPTLALDVFNVVVEQLSGWK